MKKIIAAFAGALVGFGLLFAPSAQGASKADDCRRVAKADRSLCAQVKRQTAYAYATEGAFVSVGNGRVLVREITHQGLSKREMHSYLTGEALEYAEHVTASRAVLVDMSSVKKYYGSDAQVIAGFEDADGKPGGRKLDLVRLDLP